MDTPDSVSDSNVQINSDENGKDSASALSTEEVVSKQDSPENVSSILQELVDIDQSYRDINTETEEQLRNDPEFREKFQKEMRDVNNLQKERVQELLDQGLVIDPYDLKNAGLIFQHGNSPEDFEKAFDLNIRAISKGLIPYISDLRQAFDRYMVSLQRNKGIPPDQIVQRFGMQSYMQENNGSELVYREYRLDGKRDEAIQELFTYDEKDPEYSATKWTSLGPDRQREVLRKIQSEFYALKSTTLEKKSSGN